MLITHPWQRIITFRGTAYVGARKHAGAHDQIQPRTLPDPLSARLPAPQVGWYAAVPGGYPEALVGATP